MKTAVYQMNGWHPRRVGTLEGVRGAGVLFAYAPAYLAAPDATPVSVSLPLQDHAFDERTTRTFFSGLLPEESAGEAIARRLGTGRVSTQAILSEIGYECVGDMLFVGEDEELPDGAAYRRLPPEQLDALARGSADIAVDLQMESHLSLAGAQFKVGLYRHADEWLAPVGMASSTHIVKLPNPHYDDLHINEFLCMRAARACGVPVAETFLMEDRPSLLCVERFDRALTDAAPLVGGLPMPLRLHQEDFCQALGVASERKYEEKPLGYTARIAQLIATESADALADLRGFTMLALFNYLIGNCDNHLKNISLVHNAGGQMRLAPAYDLVCTTLFPNLSRHMGIRVGKAQRIEKVEKRHWAEFGREMALSERIVYQIGASLAEQLPAALMAAAEDAPMPLRGAARAYAQRIVQDAEPRIAVLD